MCAQGTGWLDEVRCHGVDEVPCALQVLLAAERQQGTEHGALVVGVEVAHEALAGEADAVMEEAGFRVLEPGEHPVDQPGGLLPPSEPGEIQRCGGGGRGVLEVA